VLGLGSLLMDTSSELVHSLLGAFAGPLLAVLFMFWFANDIKAVLWVGVVPAFLAVLLLSVAVRDPLPPEPLAGAGRPPLLAGLKLLPRRYWLILALGGLFTLARFSEAFLILRAQDVGLAIGYVPAIMIVMNLAYAGFAYPAGVAADRIPARSLLVFGLLLLVAADLVLAAAGSPGPAFLGAALWGFHMACTQGLLAKLVADAAPREFRGTAFGLFNLVGGGSLLLASVIAGWLWSAFGAPATFVAGAAFAAVAALGLLLVPTRSNAKVQGRTA